MTSSGWIDHFYRNACSGRQALPATFGSADVRCLRAVRPGNISLRSGQLLIEKSREIAEESGDLAFAWAVRLFVREQERQNQFLSAFVPEGARPVSHDWRGSVIDAMPADLVVLLLGCRARVAARFFGAMARRSESLELRAFYERLEQGELGQVRFAAFAGPKMSDQRRPVPPTLVKSVSRAVTLGIATRVWFRQRTRLRESGQTYAAFVAAILQPAA